MQVQIKATMDVGEIIDMIKAKGRSETDREITNVEFLVDRNEDGTYTVRGANLVVGKKIINNGYR